MNREKTRRDIQKVFEKYEPIRFSFPAMLGDGQGVIAVAGRPGYVYVRIGSDEIPGTAFNQRVPLRNNLPVIVGYTPEQPELFQVLSLREVYTGVDGYDDQIVQIVAHHTTHEFLNDDVVWVQSQQFLPALCRPSVPNALTVDVYETWYPWIASWHYFEAATSANLAGSVPAIAGQARYVLISIDGATEALQATDGDLFAQFLPPPDMEDKVPAAPAGSMPIAAIYLINGQTTIDWDSIYDLRLFGQPVGGSVTPAAHDLLSAQHGDTDPQAVSEGSIVIGDATPEWTELVHPGAANRVLQTSAAGVVWSANAVTFPAAGAVPVGTGANTQVAYWTGPNTIAGDAGMTYVAATDTLSVGVMNLPATTATLGQITQVGTRVFHTYGTDNIFVGENSGNFTLTGTRLTALGADTLTATTTARECVAIGDGALGANTTGIYNVAIGSDALASNTIGQGNFACGWNSLASNIDQNNNTCVGRSTMEDSTLGFACTAMGSFAVQHNTAGFRNVGVGYLALQFNQIGDDNVVIGSYAGLGVVGNSYDDNTIIGSQAGRFLTTGSFNFLGGYKTGDVITTGDYNIIIGYDVDPSGAAVSNELNIGDLIYGDTNLNIAGINVTPPNIDRTWHVLVSDAVTAATTFTERLTHETSGAAAINFGLGTEHELEDAGGTNRIVTTIESYWTNAAAANFSSAYEINVASNTAMLEMVRMNGLDTQPVVVWNNGEADVDYRIAASGITNAFFVQGSDGYVGVGTAAPQQILDISASNVNTTMMVTCYDDGASESRFYLRKSDTDTIGTLAETDDGDWLGLLGFQGVDSGAGWAYGAFMYAIQRGAAGADFLETDLIFITYNNAGSNANQLFLDGGTANVGIYVNPTLGRLQVDNDGAIAQPVLYLDQGDVSEEMIQYETTIGVGNAIEAVGGKTLTVTHFIKVTLPGGLTRYHQVGTIA